MPALLSAWNRNRPSECALLSEQAQFALAASGLASFSGQKGTHDLIAFDSPEAIGWRGGSKGCPSAKPMCAETWVPDAAFAPLKKTPSAREGVVILKSASESLISPLQEREPQAPAQLPGWKLLPRERI